LLPLLYPQIWHALENDLYLEASRLYLLAKMVYKNLQVEEGVPFVVIVSSVLEAVAASVQL
jgi:hypothetical protein